MRPLVLLQCRQQTLRCAVPLARGHAAYRINTNVLDKALQIADLREAELLAVLPRVREWTPQVETLLTQRADLAKFSRRGLCDALVLATSLDPSPAFVTFMVTLLRIELPRQLDELEARDILGLFKALNNCRLTVENAEFAELLKLLLPVAAKLACTMDGMTLSNLIYWSYRFKVVRNVHVSSDDYRALFMALTSRMHELKSIHWLRAISTDSLKAVDLGHSFFDAYKRAVQPVLGKMSGHDLVLMVRWLALMRAGTTYLDELFFLAWAEALIPKMHEPKTDSLAGLLLSLSILRLDVNAIGPELFKVWAAEMERRTDLCDDKKMAKVLRGLRELNVTLEVVGGSLGPHLAKVFVGSKLKGHLYKPALEALGAKPEPKVAAAKT